MHGGFCFFHFLSISFIPSPSAHWLTSNWGRLHLGNRQAAGPTAPPAAAPAPAPAPAPATSVPPAAEDLRVQDMRHEVWWIVCHLRVPCFHMSSLQECQQQIKSKQSNNCCFNQLISYSKNARKSSYILINKSFSRRISCSQIRWFDYRVNPGFLRSVMTVSSICSLLFQAVCKCSSCNLERKKQCHTATYWLLSAQRFNSATTIQHRWVKLKCQRRCSACSPVVLQVN